MSLQIGVGVLVTGVNTIPCLRQISESLTAVRSYNNHAVPIAVVINRSKRRVLGGVARGKHVQAVLREEKVFFVSDNPEAFVGSANTGAPLSLGGGYRKAMREIGAVSAFCAEIKAPGVVPSQLATR